MKLLRVINKEVQENKRSLLIYSLTIFLVLFMQGMFRAFMSRQGGYSSSIYREMFPGFLFLGGFILTSVFFAQDMFSRTGQHNWLTLPASQAHKFLAKGILTALVYPVALNLLFFLSSIIIELLALLLFRDSVYLFNPLAYGTRNIFLHYIVNQSIFLLGATYFRKAHFIKTVLALSLLGITLSIITAFFVRLVFAPYFTSMLGVRLAFPINTLETHFTLTTIGRWLGGFLYWFILPLFCWFTAYLRVKEVQATDAIQ